VALLGPPELSLSSTQVTEARDKLGSAKHVAQLLGDTNRAGWTVLGEAWLDERTGNSKAAGDLRSRAEKALHINLPWPPISKGRGNDLYIPTP
jgi:hypothetical protein